MQHPADFMLGRHRREASARKGRHLTSLVTDTRFRQWLSDHPASQGAWAVFLILLSVYALTGDYDGGIRHNIDSLASALPAQRLVQHGDMDVSAYSDVPWFVEGDGRLVTDRPPGATLVAIPFYLLASPALVNSDPVIWPMAVASMLVAALAMALLYLALRHLVEPWIALAVPIAYGLTTPTWSISATTLWPHGPDQLVIAGTLLAVMAGRHLWILAPLGALGVLTRPLMAVPLVVVGCWLLWRRRFSGWCLSFCIQISFRGGWRIRSSTCPCSSRSATLPVRSL